MTLRDACCVRLCVAPNDLEWNFSCAELRALCGQHQVAKSGTKAEMAQRIRLRIYDDNETAKFRASTAQALLLEHPGKLTKAQDAMLVTEVDQRVREREEREIIECASYIEGDLFSRCGREGRSAFFFRKKGENDKKPLCRVVRMRRIRGFSFAPSWQRQVLMQATRKDEISTRILLSAMGLPVDGSYDFRSPLIWWVRNFDRDSSSRT